MQDNCVQLSSLQYWMRIIYTPIRWSKLFNHAATRHHHSHICYLSIASTFLLIRSQVRFIALKSSYWLNHIILIEHLYKLLIKPQLSNGIPMIAKVLISHHRIPICSHLPGELIVESGDAGTEDELLGEWLTWRFWMIFRVILGVIFWRMSKIEEVYSKPKLVTAKNWVEYSNSLCWSSIDKWYDKYVVTSPKRWMPKSKAGNIWSTLISSK